MTTECRKMSEFGGLTESAMSNPLSGDDRLFSALVAGCRVPHAAEAADMSERTAYRRLADPEFRRRLDAAREGVRESVLAKLVDVGSDAIATLCNLLQSEDKNIQCKAAKALLDSLMTLNASSPKSKEPEKPVGRVVLVMPDNGRDPELTNKIVDNGGRLTM